MAFKIPEHRLKGHLAAADAPNTPEHLRDFQRTFAHPGQKHMSPKTTATLKMLAKAGTPTVGLPKKHPIFGGIAPDSVAGK